MNWTFLEGEQEADPTEIDIEKNNGTIPSPISRTGQNGRISGRKDVKPNEHRTTFKPDFKFDPRK